ncbi:helix-turn-helix transcriptional regulator [Fundicoccus culcitae]|uniref:Helix-turn-helix transcriptional regulator n=1 Tax=Fundicoccus culcitae TaxID=2969821 RepID=A0ABY5P452_9LACT|nr:helix-turn-helix domain-containing protein [Fundicoccus culcitae]UUX33361.1 helix-turn-helix transcriptional regulator [Fundicoccus culcitae]
MPQNTPISFVDLETFASSTAQRLVLWEGSSDIYLNKEGFQVQAGHLLLVNGCPPLQLSAEKDTSYMVFHAPYVAKRLLPELYDLPIFHDFFMLKNSQPHYLYFQHPHDQAIQSILTILKNETTSDQINIPIIHHLLVTLLHIIHRSHQRTLIISQSSMMDSNYLSGALLKYMAEHCANVTLNQLASEFGYNPSYFSRHFKRLMGDSFSQKLKQIRLEQASRLLTYSKLAVQDIAMEVGYRDANHFYKIFKQQFGMTPMDYRRETAEGLGKKTH